MGSTFSWNGIIDVINRHGIKKTKLYKLTSEVTNLTNIPDASGLIHPNQYNSDKQDLEKIDYVDEKNTWD